MYLKLKECDHDTVRQHQDRELILSASTQCQYLISTSLTERGLCVLVI